MPTVNTEKCRTAAKRLLWTAAISFAAAAAAGATSITTTSFTTWKSSGYLTGSPTELNFMAINSSSYNTAAGFVMTPSGAATPSFDFTGVDGGAYSLAGDIYNKTLADSGSNGAFINVAFQTPENAILLGFSNNSALQYTITLSDGEVFNTTSKLFGFSMSHNITSLSVATAPGVQAVLNDFWFGTSSLAQDSGNSGTPTAATPEAGTLWLLAGGSMLLFGARRKLQATEA